MTMLKLNEIGEKYALLNARLAALDAKLAAWETQDKSATEELGQKRLALADEKESFRQQWEALMSSLELMYRADTRGIVRRRFRENDTRIICRFAFS